MTKTLFSMFFLLCCGLLAKANNSPTGSPGIASDIRISFKNDYQDTYHLALIIYTPDGKNQTRVSNLKPNQIKTYSFPIGSEIYIADWRQEAFAMKGNDLKKTGAKPSINLQSSDDKRVINLSTLAFNASPKNKEKDFIGVWQFNLGENDIVQRVTLISNNDSLCGVFFGQPFCGKVSNGILNFKIADFTYMGQLKGNNIEGTFTDKYGTVSKWKALKEIETGTPTSFTLNPTVFYRNYSSIEPPVLNLVSGDTVETSTVDASGTDKNSKKVTWGGNPLTGPFYIQNSMPGDVVAVKIISVKTNRSWAFSGRSIVDNVLETNYLTNKKNERIDNAWLISSDSSFLRMEYPSEGLKNYRIPLTPFLGSVGVAPSFGTGISSLESGNFGGNMEEKTITNGTILYLPVSVQGTFLYFGDGHAAQGDGELTGNAMETSMDIVFSVELLKNKNQTIPRTESKDFIKSIGIAATLDQAMKIATTDLTRWLETEYKLKEPEAAMIMGFSVQYEIPDLVGSNISVTAKISKKVLNSLQIK
jgi:amidase